MAISSAYCCSLIPAMFVRNRTMGIPALEDGLVFGFVDLLKIYMLLSFVEGIQMFLILDIRRYMKGYRIKLQRSFSHQAKLLIQSALARLSTLLFSSCSFSSLPFLSLLFPSLPLPLQNSETLINNRKSTNLQKVHPPELVYPSLDFS